MNLIEYLGQDGKEDGITWDEVGAKFNITGNAARKRWNRLKSMDIAEEIKPEKVLDGISAFMDSLVVPDGLVVNSVWQDAKGEYKCSFKAKTDDPVIDAGIDYDKKIKDLVTKYVPKSFMVDTEKSLEGYSEEILLFFGSDKHIGAAMDKDGVYDIPYDESVFRRRLNYCAQHIIDKSRLNGGYQDVMVFDLGDALDGYEGHTTRGGHALPQNMTSEEQWDVYVESHLDFFQTLVENDVGEYIHFYGISNANHDGAFGYTAMRALAEILKERYQGRVITDVTKDFIGHFNIETKNGTIHYLVTHGKDKKYMNRGFPLHMNDKTEIWLNNYLKDRGILGEKVVVVKGDLHQCAMQGLTHFEYINVPSIFGSSDWIVHNFGPTDPATYFEVIDGNGQRQQTFLSLKSA